MTTAVATEQTPTPAATPAAPTPAATAPVEATPASPTPAATPAAVVTPEPSATPTPPEGTPPQAPESYALTLPETTQLTPEYLPLIEAEAKALGLTNDQAQALVNARSEVVAAQTQHYLTEAKADPEIGGPLWDTTIRHANAGLEFLFPKDSDEGRLVRGWFDHTGLGNHKTFLRAMARIGKARAEDTPPQPGSHRTAERKPDHEVMYPTMAEPSA